MKLLFPNLEMAQMAVAYLRLQKFISGKVLYEDDDRGVFIQFTVHPFVEIHSDGTLSACFSLGIALGLHLASLRVSRAFLRIEDEDDVPTEFVLDRNAPETL